MFTVMMAVYNAPAATELTLKTLYASSSGHISKILIYDSSSDVAASRVVDEFAANVSICKVIRNSRTSHKDALYRMLEEDIETPYIFMSDSDVEYYNCLHFDEALDVFENPSIGIAGEHCRSWHGLELEIKNQTKVTAILAERIAPWALFVRTEIAKKHKNSILDYGLDDGVFYDTTAKFYKTILENGYGEHRTSLGDGGQRQGKTGVSWTHYTNASWKGAEIVENLARSRLDSKVWENIENKCRKRV